MNFLMQTESFVCEFQILYVDVEYSICSLADIKLVAVDALKEKEGGCWKIIFGRVE